MQIIVKRLQKMLNYCKYWLKIAKIVKTLQQLLKDCKKMLILAQYCSKCSNCVELLVKYNHKLEKSKNIVTNH